MNEFTPHETNDNKYPQSEYTKSGYPYPGYYEPKNARRRKAFPRRLPALLLAAALLTACLFSVPGAVSAADTARLNWFFKPNGNDRPEIMGGDPMPERYGAVFLGDPDEKVIYLTFDAGYGNENVAKILDALKKHRAKGAFFILPGIVRYSPDLVKRMADEGHTVCNHSTTHKDLSAASKSVLQNELRGVEEQYSALTGRTMAKFFRPPEGCFSERLLQYCKEEGYRPVFWSFAYADWDNNRQPDPEQAKRKLLANLHNGEVLLLHPTSATNASIMDDLLTEIESRGFRFGVLDEFRADAEPTVSIEEYKAQGMVFAENRAAGKTLALTFDDGPHPTQTDEILAVLRKYGVKATFFPIGKNVGLYPEVERRVRDAGHEIGSHTYSHATVTNLTKEQLRKELLDTEAVLLEQCGVRPTVFRPPGGAYSDEAIRTVGEMGYRYVLWAWRVDPRDWAGTPAKRIAETVLSNVRDGDVLLFHDYVSGSGRTAEALEILIPELQRRGYSFVTVSELASL